MSGAASTFRFCPLCAQTLVQRELAGDGGPKLRLCCSACDFVHWNNPTPVLAAIVELDGQILLARNAAWPGRWFGLITGFMEAAESPQAGMTREIAEETGLVVSQLSLVGVYEFERMNQVIIAYHALAHGQVVLSPELAEYQLFAPRDVVCWPSGTGYALRDWLRTQGTEPPMMSWQEREALKNTDTGARSHAG